jgi:hypothetical protein
MRSWHVLGIVALLVASCSSASATKTVDYDWSASAKAAHDTAVASVKRECVPPPSSTVPGSPYDPADYPITPDPSCVASKGKTAFDAAVPNLRDKALEQVCNDSQADRVRLTTQDFDGNRITTVVDCPR